MATRAGLAGKCAIVTGGAMGLGEAQVRALAAEGARVVCADIDQNQGTKLASELGEGVSFFHHDVTDASSWARLLAFAEEHYGYVSVLVNNAGILRMGCVAEMAEDDFRQVIDVNLTGAFLGMKAVVGSMKKAGAGSIVNISSVQGFAPYPGMVAYVASKFAIRGMTKVAALELGKDNIRVNSVHPGAILTPMAERNGSRPPSNIPIARFGKPSEVAGMVTFLASDESCYCTGSEFIVDGGYLNVVGESLMD